jgi:hypothetical protein
MLINDEDQVFDVSRRRLILTSHRTATPLQLVSPRQANNTYRNLGGSFRLGVAAPQL